MFSTSTQKTIYTTHSTNIDVLGLEPDDKYDLVLYDILFNIPKLCVFLFFAFDLKTETTLAIKVFSIATSCPRPKH